MLNYCNDNFNLCHIIIYNDNKGLDQRSKNFNNKKIINNNNNSKIYNKDKNKGNNNQQQ